MATLRHRNGIYFIDYRINGRRFRKTVGKSKKIADLTLKDFEVKIAKNELGFEPKDNSLSKLFDDYLAYSKTNHSPSTQKRYRAILDHFKGFLHHYPYITKISHVSPIHNGLIGVLKNHKEETQKGPYVFHNGGGQLIEPNSLRKKLMRITKKCGFPDVTKLHTLRHTFASHLVMNGVDLPTVKKLMGHADIQTTMIYSHLADEHVDGAVEKLTF